MEWDARTLAWRLESAVESVLFWSIGSLVLAAVATLPYWQGEGMAVLAGWLGVHLVVLAAAAGCWWYLHRQREFAARAAHVVLLLSALAWGAGGALYVAQPSSGHFLPMVLALVGLTVLAVGLFARDAMVMGAMVVVMLAPMAFTLLAAQGSYWLAMLVTGLLVVAAGLSGRRVQALAEQQQQLLAQPVAKAMVEARPRDAGIQAAVEAAEIARLREEVERHRNLEKEMEAARQLAESANMAKGEFLATMSHEMRTPLNGIIPLLEILRDTKLQPDQRDYLNTAYQSAKHLLRIIDDILDYSKIEANKLDLETVGLNLREVVDSVVRMLEKTAEGKGLKIQVVFDPNVRLACRGDPVRLRQVLSNLVSNAIKFTDRGQVTIQVSRRGETRTHSELMFAVKDTGVGISKEKADRLFQPFSQADTSTTRNYGGTGLGLVICKRIVELMGGQIGLKSEVGRGSIFWFTVPLLKAIGDLSAVRKDLSGVRALIVSTEPKVIQRLSGYFQMWGMSQISTNTTADALSKLKSSATLGENWAFDVVFVDLGTMRQTAPALARNVVREPALERLRMVFVEGEDNEAIDLQVEAARGLTIPRHYGEGELSSTLNKLLQVEQAGERRMSLMEEAARLGIDLGSSAGGQSEPQRGSAPVPAGGAGESAARPAIGQASGPVKGHALLVEDNPVNRQVAQRLLGLIGISFEIAENGKEAFEMMGKGGYDVVLMDCQMPVMDGYTATRSRRTMESERELPRIPIIAMTANAMAGDREKCLASGMDDYMSKPLNRGLLEQTIRKWLPKRPLEVEGTAEAPAPAPPAPAPAVRLTEPVKMTPSKPAIKEDIVNELIDVMGGEFTQLVKVYLEDTPKNLKLLDAAAERGDTQAMIAPAHSLKSTSANLGAMALSDLAKLIEHGARAGTLRDSTGMARQAGVEFRRAAEELERLLQKAGN
jgi:signal transduction histidine kinase/CheY-like chemotaxis protein/HPt (histidine-containing phosphotransfer) domain-containing protein